MMKISILCYDVSANAFGRAYLLARLLQPKYKVEIVGLTFGDGIWLPLRDNTQVETRHIRCERGFSTYGKLRELVGLVDGDVIYASKPLFTSYIVGLLGKRHRPIVLDIDDWELGFAADYLRGWSWHVAMRHFAKSLIFPHGSNSYFGAWISQKLVPLAAQITVSNTFLQERFGGTLIPHGRDESAFVPGAWDQDRLKRKYGFDAGARVLMFLGTPRRHKGIEDLIRAVGLIRKHGVILAVVGIDRSNRYAVRLAESAQEELGSSFKGFEPCPFGQVAEFMALSDIVVVPQQRRLASAGQMPAKVIDAMAMAKPIVATAISDIPQVLEDCGWVVEPSNPRALAEAILEILANPAEASTRGRTARAKFLERYSWSAIRPQLLKVFSPYEP